MAKGRKHVTPDQTNGTDDRLADHKERTAEIAKNREWLKAYTDNYNFGVVKRNGNRAKKAHRAS